MLFFYCHVLLSQEQHSINVLLSLSCPTSTEDKIQYKFYPLLSRLASTRTTFNICLVLVILSWIHKNEIQYMFCFLFSCLTSTITTLHMFSFCYLVMFLLCCLMSIKKKKTTLNTCFAFCCLGLLPHKQHYVYDGKIT